MKLTENWQYRARIHFLQKEAIKCFKGEKHSNEDANFRKQIHNGYMPDECAEAFESFVNKHKNSIFSNEPLSFQELASYSTYFAMHPEKVLGKEVVTSSLHFPIQINGSKDDVINGIDLISKAKPTNDKAKRIRIAKAKVKVLKLKLKLAKAKK